jgi:uncharacterized protein YkwD
MDQSLRQRISSAVASPSLRFGALTVSEISLPWTISRNRQKVLGFAAMAVSLVLISAPFVLNVDNDVVAKAQTVAVEASSNTAEVITEMATAEDVVVALNAARGRAGAASVVPDTQLELGAQGWASNVAENASIRTDRSLRALLNNRQAVGEFVVAAPSLSIAYQRLMANPVQEAQLLGSSLDTVGVGVQAAGGKTYLVFRFAS